MSEESKILDLKSVEAIRDWVKDNFVTKNELLKLGLTSQLYVTFDEDFVGQTYSITGGDKTYSGVVPESKEVIVLVNAPNTAYTVTCPNTKGVEYTCKVTVGSKSGRYAGKLEGFYAFLHIQAEIGAIVTATLDDKSYTAEIGEDGYCTLKVKDSGTYSVVAAIGKSMSEAVEAVVGETTGETVEVVCGEIPLEIVSWSNGTDVQIARMIDAARAGKIDLQADGGWKVGNARVITRSAFSAGNTTYGGEVTCKIAISSFEDYNNCGCLMQFDFINPVLWEKIRFKYTSKRSYDNTLLCKEILPGLAEALPAWLSARLIKFPINIMDNLGSNTTLSVVEGNKLALRARSEIIGKGTEGDQVEYYKTEDRRKKSNTEYNRVNWWTRSPYSDGKQYYYVSTGGTLNTADASITNSDTDGESYSIMPFGCL